MYDILYIHTYLCICIYTVLYIYIYKYILAESRLRLRIITRECVDECPLSTFQCRVVKYTKFGKLTSFTSRKQNSTFENYKL